MEWAIPALAALLAVSGMKLLEVVIASSPTFSNRREASITDQFMDSLRERAIDAELEREEERKRADKLQEINNQLEIEQAILRATVERLELEIQALQWRVNDLENQSGMHDIPDLGD